MEKLIANLSAANSFAGVTSGILTAQTILRRKLLEAETEGERLILLSAMKDIVDLLDQFEVEYINSKV